MTVSAIPLAEYHSQLLATGDYNRVCRMAVEMGHQPEDVRGPSRRQEYVEVRRIIAVALRALGWSYPRIGRALGNRHHTSIMNLLGSIKKVQRWKHMRHIDTASGRGLCGVDPGDGQRATSDRGSNCPTCVDLLSNNKRGRA